MTALELVAEGAAGVAMGQETRMALVSMNPANGARLAEFEEASGAQVAAAVDRAHAAFQTWRAVPLRERVELVARLPAVIERHAEDLARLASLEMGKPIVEASAEVAKSAGFCQFYADRAEELLAPRRIEGGQLENWVRYDPLGVVLAVMPWNFPYVQVFRFAPAMLVAGNTVLLKHASNIPQCALRIEELFREAGLPEGVFQTLLVGPQAVDGVLSDPRVRGVTLTGSEAAGSKVAAIAGRELKKSVMELGGSDAFVVLDDADIRYAAAQGCRSRFTNSGQACINAKRFIVLESIADEFEVALVEEVARLQVGDPLDPETTVGPLAHPQAVETLRAQVDDSVRAGATIRTGGFDWEGPGAYVRPIVLTDVRPGMRVLTEETFGPVAAVVRVPDERAAIEMANDSQYGLGASVWTSDRERGRRVAEQIEAGMVFVNAIVVSDARLPFGGMKRSGYGRELGEWGIREFTELKSIAVDPQPDTVLDRAAAGAAVE
jgi:succinate-semialdehyde dehydrogenase/glutarate-semialdehyde dehydrogenase